MSAKTHLKEYLQDSLYGSINNGFDVGNLGLNLLPAGFIIGKYCQVRLQHERSARAGATRGIPWM
jgi:hypothetical protein